MRSQVRGNGSGVHHDCDNYLKLPSADVPLARKEMRPRDFAHVVNIKMVLNK